MFEEESWEGRSGHCVFVVDEGLDKRGGESTCEGEIEYFGFVRLKALGVYDVNGFEVFVWVEYKFGDCVQ